MRCQEQRRGTRRQRGRGCVSWENGVGRYVMIDSLPRGRDAAGESHCVRSVWSYIVKSPPTLFRFLIDSESRDARDTSTIKVNMVAGEGAACQFSLREGQDWQGCGTLPDCTEVSPGRFKWSEGRDSRLLFFWNPQHGHVGGTVTGPSRAWKPHGQATGPAPLAWEGAVTWWQQHQPCSRLLEAWSQKAINLAALSEG